MNKPQQLAVVAAAVVGALLPGAVAPSVASAATIVDSNICVGRQAVEIRWTVVGKKPICVGEEPPSPVVAPWLGG